MAKAKRKRYSAAKKQEIIDFVKDFNQSNKGRGGQAAASKKYKVSQLSISNWLKGGDPSKKKVSKKKASKRKVSKRTAASTGGSSAKGSIASVLKRMTAIQEEISVLNAEYEALKKQL